MATAGFSRTRPGGTPPKQGTNPGGSNNNSGGGGGIFQSILDFFNPTKPIPGTHIGGLGSTSGLGLPSLSSLDPFSGVEHAINDTTDFLRIMAWIFHPINWLRAVEFLSGITLMLFGINLMFKFSESALKWPAPFGSAARRARGARQGRAAGQRQEARSRTYHETRQREAQRAQRKQTQKRQTRQTRQRRGNP